MNPRGPTTVVFLPVPDGAPPFGQGLLPAADPTATLAALVATGLAPWDAMLALVDAGVDPAAFTALHELPASAFKAYPSTHEAVLMMELLARVSKPGAMAMANAYLGGRRVEGHLHLGNQDWLTALPSGLEVEGNLGLDRTHNLRRLPDGLRVGGRLALIASGIRVLPERLVVGAELLLNGADDWIGLIPEDARIGGVVTFRNRDQAMSLADWRAIYPLGEPMRNNPNRLVPRW
jgi:hypothetical protein